MALNDWRDREADRRLRSDRPVPSGRIPAGAAKFLGFGLVAAGPLVALQVSRPCAASLGVAAVAALVYDLWLRGPWLGPSLLAVCRGANLATGIVLGTGASLAGAALLPPIAYGLYVFTVSRLARLEDVDEGSRSRANPALLLAIAAFLLVLAPAAGILHPLESRERMWAALLLAGAGAAGLIQAARHTGIWSGDDVTWATGLALRRLLVFTAAVALCAGGSAAWLVAAAILCGYPISFALRGVFPPS